MQPTHQEAVMRQEAGAQQEVTQQPTGAIMRQIGGAQEVATCQHDSERQRWRYYRQHDNQLVHREAAVHQEVVV